MDLKTLKTATLVGTIMASFTVEQFGTSGLEHLTDQTINARLDAFRHMIAI
jgi:hypothetical protein